MSLAGLGVATVLVSGNVAQAADLPSRVVAPAAPLSQFFLFQDTSIGYKLDTAGTDPGSNAHFAKHSIDLTHVDAWIYGTNFVNVEIHKSASLDPASPILQSQNAPYTTFGAQAVELYAVYRGTLSGNAITHSKMFSWGPIKDISLEAGGDYEVENNAFAPNKQALVGGIQIAFDVPGFLTLGINAYHEWNHDALSQVGNQYGFTSVNTPTYNALSGAQNFKTTADFELAYMQPLTFTGLPLKFSGFTNVILPKGQNAPLFNGGVNYTRTEILSENRLTLDVGKLAWGRPDLVDVFVGYKYWWNKFGDNAAFGSPSFLPGDSEHEFIAGMNWHL